MDLSQLTKMSEYAQDMKRQLDEKTVALTVEATSGGGAVTVRMNGKKEVLALTIAPSAVSAAAGDITMLEDLVLAALREATRKASDAAEAVAQSSAASILGGFNLPGL